MELGASMGFVVVPNNGFLGRHSQMRAILATIGIIIEVSIGNVCLEIGERRECLATLAMEHGSVVVNEKCAVNEK